MASSPNTVPLAIIFGGIILAIAVFFALREDTRGLPRLPASASVRPVGATDHILGNPTAPITIIEYTDFDCSYCKTFDTVMRQIVAEHGVTGEVAWVVRNFALTELHPNAKRHAEAAECVAVSAGNDAYWEFIESLFLHQPTEPTRYAEFAKAAGADPAKLAACLQNPTTVDADIDADRENAIAAGAEGTPYSILLIKDKEPLVLSGAWGYADLKALIERTLEDLQ